MDAEIKAATLPPTYRHAQDLKNPSLPDIETIYPRWARPGAEARSGTVYGFCKRGFDLLTVLFALAIAAPVLLLIALAVKLDSRGPVLFAHIRTGRNSIPFRMYKFRTMVVGSETRREELAALNELQWPEFKIGNDPRMTRIGKFLRKTSLDELPQLFNILRGDMSLVGPRPSSVMLEKYEPWQLRRLDIVPGLTGPAQIWARNANFDQKCHYDIAYVKNRTFLLDLYLLYRTMLVVLIAPNGK
ncbi:MAG: sugar transferase [Pseudorhodobacter sp.]|nr:sugar transferase [Pseudorhodobacter sp.]